MNIVYIICVHYRSTVGQKRGFTLLRGDVCKNHADVPHFFKKTLKYSYFQNIWSNYGKKVNI